MNKFPSVISFIGPDGAGKTTQRSLIKRYLNVKGVKTSNAWISSHQTLTYLIRRITKKFVKEKFFYNPKIGRKVYLPFLPLTELGRKIWTGLEVFSLLIVLIVQVKIPKLLGYTILLERGIPSTLADLKYALGSFPLTSLTGKFLLKLIYEDTLFIFLDSNYQNISRRRGNRKEPYRYIKVQRETYEKLAKRYDFFKVYTPEFSKTETFKSIKNHLTDREGGNYIFET